MSTLIFYVRQHFINLLCFKSEPLLKTFKIKLTPFALNLTYSQFPVFPEKLLTTIVFRGSTESPPRYSYLAPKMAILTKHHVSHFYVWYLHIPSCTVRVTGLHHSCFSLSLSLSLSHTHTFATAFLPLLSFPSSFFLFFLTFPLKRSPPLPPPTPSIFQGLLSLSPTNFTSVVWHSSEGKCI